jgi:ribosomal protein L7/L12
VDLLLIGFILLSLVLLAIVIEQNKKIQLLEEQNRKLRNNESQDELADEARRKLEMVGFVKTVKFVREETGMSLLEAKQFVDQVEAGNK